MWESEFEHIVCDHADVLFPGRLLVPFKVIVESSLDAAKPDLAAIDQQYRQWSVVEIEMAHHSLRQHVLPQVETLVSGHYGDDHTKALIEADQGLAADRLHRLVRSEQPEVIVVVNDPVPEWETPLRQAGATLMSVQVYRSEFGRTALSVHGEARPIPDQVIGKALVDQSVPRMVKIERASVPAEVKPPQVVIRVGEGLIPWHVVCTRDQTLLVSQGPPPFAPGQVLWISRDTDGTLRLDVADGGTRR